MDTQKITIEANSLDEAEELLKAQLPEDQRVVREDIITVGQSQWLMVTATLVTWTKDQLWDFARSQVPNDAEILDIVELSSIKKKTISIEASDEREAMEIAVNLANRDYGEASATSHLTLISAGSKGILGIGKKPSKYEATIGKLASAKIQYKKKARITFTISPLEGPDEAVVIALHSDIVKAFEEPNKEVRQETIEALNKLGWRPDKSEIAALYWIAQKKTYMCGEIGSAAVEPLIKLLNQKNSISDAISILGKIGDKRAVQPLINLFNAPNQETNRYGIVRALGHIGDVQAIPSLFIALKDSNPSVREGAVIALGQIDDPQTKDFLDKSLLARLSDIESWIRAKAAEELQNQGDQRVSQILSKLVPLLSDPDGKVRLTAARSLGEIGDSRSIETLLAGLNDPEWRVRGSVAEALGHFKDERITEALVNALDKEVSSNQSVRISIIESLGRIADEGAVDILIRSIKDRDKFIGYKAVQVLGSIGALKAVDALIAALTWETSIAREAVSALGKIGDKKAIEPIVLYAQRDIGNAGVFADKDVQELTNQYSKLAAAEGLVQLDSEKAFEIFRQQAELLTSNFTSINTLPDEVNGERGRINKDNNKKLRVEVVRILKMLRDNRATEILSKLKI